VSANGAAGRRRRWRPLLGVAAAAAALLAVRLMAPRLAPEPLVPSPTSGISRPTGSLNQVVRGRLLLATDDGLFRVDVDIGAVRAVALGGLAPGAIDRRLVRQHGTVIVVRDRAAHALPASLDRPMVRLGRASFAVPSTRADRMWLVEQAPDPDRWFTVREIRLDGTPTSPARTLPLGRIPRAGVPGGLLISALGEAGGLLVWEPVTGRTRLLAPSGASFVAARDAVVAWSAGGRLHLTDVRSGQDRTVAALPGAAGFDPVGAFSPDGAMLAVITVPAAFAASALVLVDLRRGSVRRVEGAEGALSGGCDPCLSWSPAGDDLFFARVGPTFGVGAYRLGAPRATVLPFEVPGVSPPSLLVL
jgi:hypothetical protein